MGGIRGKATDQGSCHPFAILQGRREAAQGPSRVENIVVWQPDDGQTRPWPRPVLLVNASYLVLNLLLIRTILVNEYDGNGMWTSSYYCPKNRMRLMNKSLAISTSHYCPHPHQLMLGFL